MPKRVLSLQRGQPLLDIVSYARRGPGRQGRLSRQEREHIARTVRRAPEVMIKVLTHGGQSLHAIQRHIDYITRGGELELETDEGETLKGKGVEKDLLNDWDLDLDTYRRHVDLAAATGRRPPKLVHKLMFSMPAGTPPDKVLLAVRHFAHEQFGGQHEYVMTLHTDEPHPHVHMVLKAVSEQGLRLNIRKETLRTWRQEFARHLRKLGVAANATERAVRGQSKTNKMDGIYRAERRGASTHSRERAEAVASQILKGDLRLEPGKEKLAATRREVERGWRAISDILTREGHRELAAQTKQFVDQMTPAQTENEQIAAELLELTREARVRDNHPTR